MKGDDVDNEGESTADVTMATVKQEPQSDVDGGREGEGEGESDKKAKKKKKKKKERHSESEVWSDCLIFDWSVCLNLLVKGEAIEKPPKKKKQKRSECS